MKEKTLPFIMGNIISSKIVPSPTDSDLFPFFAKLHSKVFNKLYDVNVLYEYVIHDMKYYGNASPSKEYIELSYDDAKAILESEFHYGDSIKVYYDPKDIKKSCLYYESESRLLTILSFFYRC